MSGGVVRGLIVPGKPHPLLAADRCAPWAALRASFDRLRDELAQVEADVLLLYSTQWLSVIGHQVQADPGPEWVHVDPEWHEFGSIPYRLRMDADFATAYRDAATARGLHARTVAYRGFPVDTGTVVALQLLDPERRLPACVVSCNMYADRGETLVLGKAAADALRAQGKRAVAVAVTSLSNRYHVDVVAPEDDRISSLKDDEWNRKLLELLGEGRLEDCSQLAREFSAQANGDQKMKALWWLAAAMGQHNRYTGRVLDYQPVYGTGAAIVDLVPSAGAAGALEYDEEDTDYYVGDREVLAGGAATTTAPVPAACAVAAPGVVRASGAPEPVGAYPHARRVGDLLFLSGVGPRQAGSDAIPGGPVRGPDGEARDYDVRAQTEAVIANVEAVLEAAGSSLAKVIDVTVFLIDMDRDFETFNAVYREHFETVQASRTTIAIDALPTPIAVEFKVVAAAG
ncbi:MAG TPA: Rid family hydrolase [Planctomycetota bacterium]